MKVLNGLVMTLEEDKCLAALLYEQFCRFANGGARISIKFFSIKISIEFFFSVYSAAVKC